jgi:hypothetical protein
MHKALLLGSLILGAAGSAYAANPILGEVELEAATKLERDAGVWLDGQYVGYVKDLQGKKGKLVMLPGKHNLLFKLIGYQDIASTIIVEPGQQTRYSVALNEAPNLTYPEKAETAQLRISVEPESAAIFVNDAYVGHVDRFNGRKGMRLTPGTYRFTIALPGYQSFETELTLRASQAYEIKTVLAPGTIGEQAGALTASTLSDVSIQ